MFKIYCPIINKNNNSELQQDLISFQKQNPCCPHHLICDHPKLQSCDYLHNTFIIFKDSLESIFNNIKIDKMWCFITYSNNKINSFWHNHGNKENKYSAICYLNNTFGTEFEDGSIIDPLINTWYIWESYKKHRPIQKQIDNLRINIVADIYL
jgi:hypothetical protein